MKKGNEKSLKKGISLIVLVITIIVIVVLATAVILSIANNNPIDNAREAVEKNNEAEYKSELSLYIAKQYADNQGNFSLNDVNAFSKEEVEKVITSMKDEDLDDYIIWQGELVKKESDGCYYYENGEVVKTFDMQVSGSVDSTDESKGRQKLNQNMVDFLIEFEKIQENYSEENKLIYNEGYITNCLDKIVNLKEKLPEGVVIKDCKLSSEKAESYNACTDDGIYYNGELVARFVVFGDVDIEYSLYLNRGDATTVNNLVNNKGEGYTLGQIIASDITEDGLLTLEDYNVFLKLWSNWRNSGNQKRPAIVPSF